MMHTQAALQQQAITAAKHQDWSAAVAFNSQIVELNAQDLGAMNRLGVAQLNLGEVEAAKGTFKQVLSIDKSNAIAKKHLQKLQTNSAPITPTFASEYFIEEPGKTKTVELHRLAGKNVLEHLSVGQAAELKLKNRFISVEVEGKYLGALPEDVSFRLCNLLKTGNVYACYIQSFTTNSCSVFIKELTRSPENEFTNSFPVVKTSLAAINDIDDQYLFEDNIPVQTGDEEVVEVDVEKNFEDYSD